jgi:hypothetical protein
MTTNDYIGKVSLSSVRTDARADLQWYIPRSSKCEGRAWTHKHAGRLNLFERNLDSQPKRGTTIHARVPLRSLDDSIGATG